LLGDADDDPWPREPGFALRPELVTIAAEASVAGSPLAATPPAWRAIAGALAAAGGSLRQRLLLELVELDASALEAALRDMSAAGLLQLQHGAVRVAAPAAIAPLVDHARVPEVAQRLATLLRARLRAGREESLELLAQVSARAHSADAPRAWLDAARARLSAGDARGAAACVGAAGVPADAEFERTLRGTLDARLAAVEEAPATPPAAARELARPPRPPSTRGSTARGINRRSRASPPYAPALELIPDDRVQGRWRLRLGYAALRTGDRGAAARHLQAALTTAEQHGDIGDECRASLGLLLVHAAREAPGIVRAALDAWRPAPRPCGAAASCDRFSKRSPTSSSSTATSTWRGATPSARVGVAALDDGFSDHGPEATAARIHLTLGQPAAGPARGARRQQRPAAGLAVASPQRGPGAGGAERAGRSARRGLAGRGAGARGSHRRADGARRGAAAPCARAPPTPPRPWRSCAKPARWSPMTIRRASRWPPSSRCGSRRRASARGQRPGRGAAGGLRSARPPAARGAPGAAHRRSCGGGGGRARPGGRASTRARASAIARSSSRSASPAWRVSYATRLPPR
jgi:hypothetical protein